MPVAMKAANAPPKKTVCTWTTPAAANAAVSLWSGRAATVR
jgi:hypothetical protein